MELEGRDQLGGLARRGVKKTWKMTDERRQKNYRKGSSRREDNLKKHTGGQEETISHSKMN